MKARMTDLFRKGEEWVVMIATRSPLQEIYDRLKDKDCEITIQKFSQKRSRTANAFCWALCSDIGKAMTPPMDKEEVYRRAIRAAGVFETYSVKETAVEDVKRRWALNGSGWFVDVVDNDWFKGMKMLHVYYGTSTYTADEMSKLIDWLVDEAEQMEIPIPLSKAEQERLIEKWGVREKEND